MIPEAAVEAAWDKLHENPVRPIGIDYAELEAALEAAAPHMLAGAWEAGFGKGSEFEGWSGAVDGYKPDFTNPYRTTK